jgi:hypothetical protein
MTRAWKAIALLSAAVGMTLFVAQWATAATPPLAGVTPYQISVNTSGELSGIGFPPCPPCLTSEAEPIAPGTSPSVVETPGLGYEVALQGTNGHLWFTGTLVSNDDTGIQMAPGTSPALTPFNGSFQAAWQGANGDVWITSPQGPIDLGVAMAPHTSPALTEMNPNTSFPNGGYAVAVNGSNGNMWEITPNGATDSGISIAASTSPAIAELGSGQLNNAGRAGKVDYEAAWHGGNGDLFTLQLRGFVDEGLAMAPGSSPSLTRWSPSVSNLALGGYDVAFPGSNGNLWIFGSWTFGSPPPVDTGLPMLAGTNPSIAGTILAVAGAKPAPDYYIAYASPTGEVFLETKDAGPGMAADTGTSVATGTSPSITALAE